jgi:hypothetical protein
MTLERDVTALVTARNEVVYCGCRVKAWIATARHVASSSRLKAVPRNDGVGWRRTPAVIARNEAMHCGRWMKAWIATALRASQ